MSDIAKKSAANAAARLIKNHMIVGLGTGSTAAFFINALIDRCKQGLKINAIATSTRSYELAKAGGIQMLNIEELTTIDIVVDGADEIDEAKRMIKGGGGALLREKIVASMSQEMVVVIDASKRVKQLGHFPLPVEIVPFAHLATIHHLEKLGYQGKLRSLSTGELYVTDNGNYIFDIKFEHPILDPEADNRRIRNIPGVVETGFFFQLAGRVITGFEDGHVEIQS